MKKLTWPAWFNSPDGKASAIFEAPEDVPSGWTSGAEKQTVDEKPKKSTKKQDDKKPESLDL